MSIIALLIPHYNNITGLKRSLASVQETIPVDAVVVDDGSDHPPSQEDLQQVFKGGEVKLIALEDNKGIEHALNSGLDYIVQRGYRYVARLDCGDLNVENRLGIQKAYLEDHPKVRLLGSHVEFLAVSGKKAFTYKVPEKHEDIKRKMHLKVMFIHPSVMFHTDVVKNLGHYPLDYPAAEDYAYFFSILERYKTANVPEVLVRCEWSSIGISAQKRKRQLQSKMQILKKHFYFGWYPIAGLVITYVQMILPASWVDYLKTKLFN